MRLTNGRVNWSADTIRYVLLEGIDPEQSCLISTLISAAIGFIAGFFSWPNDRAARLSTVMAARYAANYSSNSTVAKLPRVPRGIFLSLLAMAVPFIKGTCLVFPGHILLVVALALSGISSGAWLLRALALQTGADAQRKSHIEDFISSEPGNEPVSDSHIEESPAWLRTWEVVNCVAYIFIVATILLPFFESPSA
jgi:hypothetical protein